MSETSQNNKDNQEIDLSQISKKIGNFFEGISTKIFTGILFIKRNALILISLLIVGIIGGYFIDQSSTTYEHELIVAPNFGSTDYLYNKINLLESKINEGDTVYLKSIGIKKPKNLLKIEIEPIIDVYNFVNSSTTVLNNAQNTQNFELVKLLSEDGDINKVIKDKITSKNYGHHVIQITTKHIVSNKSMINPIFDYLNKNDYFQNVQKTYINNIKIKMKQSEGVIEQINTLLNQFSSTTGDNQKSDKLVYYNENTQLNEIIQTKNNLVNELGAQRMDLVNFDEIIKKNTVDLNIKNNKGINGKMKLVLPFLLMFCFMGLSLFRNFYKKQSAKMSLK
jgi:hypothetical protein